MIGRKTAYSVQFPWLLGWWAPFVSFLLLIWVESDETSSKWCEKNRRFAKWRYDALSRGSPCNLQTIYLFVDQVGILWKRTGRCTTFLTRSSRQDYRQLRKILNLVDLLRFLSAWWLLRFGLADLNLIWYEDRRCLLCTCSRTCGETISRQNLDPCRYLTIETSRHREDCYNPTLVKGF